jgi:peptidoglycan/xylan/chitin deacetylase (PgdA/CDA1 family)
MQEDAKPLASLSLDLDNQWSYMKTHGDAGWEAYPSYLDRFVAVALPVLERLRLRITFFIVGADAERPENREALQRIAAAGHEIGNHSHRHEPWLHRYGRTEIASELARAEDAIERATGARTRGFRGPGYSLSRDVLEELALRGYRYDASTLPTWIGPAARAHYFMTAKLDARQREERAALFGGVRDVLQPIAPYRWRLGPASLVEIPVTTFPVLRVPFHLSYVLFLAGRSRALALAYFRAALAGCRAAGVAPSILLHPLDFLGADDVNAVAFFPGMQLAGERKREIVERALARLAERFAVVGVGEHAARVAQQPALRSRSPRA